MGRVIVVGSINQDITVTVDRFPRPGETLSGTSTPYRLGGKGANQAAAAAHGGATTLFVGRVGGDAAGITLREELHAHGVDVSALRDYRKFADGELDIDLGMKRWFRVMSHLVEEVGDLDDNQTALVLALAEIGHAAAHLGHLNTALSRGGRTEADVKYEELNRAYVGFGFKCAETYLNLIQKH